LRIAAAAALAAGCASPHALRPAGLAQASAAQEAALAARTASRLDGALAEEERPPAERARDAYTHPRDTLLFFGLRPQQTVLEAWPASGYYTAIIAPVLAAGGRYYAAELPADASSRFVSGMRDRLQLRLAAHPQRYERVELTAFGPHAIEPAPAGSVDLALAFCTLHDWLAEGWAPQALAALHRALRPGGVLGVVDHRGDPARPQDPRARSGYVQEAYAVQLIEAAGFRLLARSELNANPRDTRDYPQGVWTLPPTYRLGERDRARYAAIGESDRFTLKFLRP